MQKHENKSGAFLKSVKKNKSGAYEKLEKVVLVFIPKRVRNRNLSVLAWADQSP